jgi:hypothetical protein
MNTRVALLQQAMQEAAAPVKKPVAKKPSVKKTPIKRKPVQK